MNQAPTSLERSSPSQPSNSEIQQVTVSQSERVTANITQSETEDAKVRILIEMWLPSVFCFYPYSTLDSFLWKGSHLFQQGSHLCQVYFLVS